MTKPIVRLQKASPGLDGWNIYVERPFKLVSIYPDAQTIYLEIEDEPNPTNSHDVEIKVRYREDYPVKKED